MSNQNNQGGSSQPQMTRRSALKLGLGTSVALGLFGLNARIVVAQEGQVLKVAHPAFNQDWSPLRGGGPPYRWNSAWWASPMYFDSKGELHPYVFTSWEPDADKKVWTFKIDPKAVFSDGSKITAEDVKGSWNVSAMPNTKNQRADQVLSKVAGYADVSGGKAKEISGIATPDENTVVVTLSESDPIFFMRLGNHIAPITKASQSRGEDGEEVADWYMPANSAVYSGPFKLTSIDLDAGKLVFEPNENFFGPKPKLARIEIDSIEDNVTATSLLKSGEYNAHTELVTSTIVPNSRMTNARAVAIAPKRIVSRRAVVTREGLSSPVGKKSISVAVASALMPAEMTAMVAPTMAAMRSPGRGDGSSRVTK